MLPSARCASGWLEACSQASSRPCGPRRARSTCCTACGRSSTPSLCAPAAQVVARHVAEQQILARARCHSGPSVKMKPVASFSKFDRRGRRRSRSACRESRRVMTCFPAALPSCSSLTRAGPTYQSSAVTSSNTTQIASLGSFATSLMVSVTRRAISSLRSCEWPFEDADVHERHGVLLLRWSVIDDRASSSSRSAAIVAQCGGGPEKRTAPFSRTYTRSASASEKSTPCSASRIVRPSRFRLPNLLQQVLHHERRQAFRRLVEQQQLGIAHQRARDRQHLLLAARQNAALPVGQLAQLREQLADGLDGPAARPARSARRRRRGSPMTVSSAKMRRSSGTKPMPERADADRAPSR